MIKKRETVLVTGFNTRPLAYSLKKAGYEVYVVDFFGDLDLYPYIKDSIIISKELDSKYDTIKGSYQHYLVNYTLELLNKYPDLENLIIASGLDDYIIERKKIINQIINKNYKIKNLNNDIDVIQKSRNIIKVYKMLIEMGYNTPYTLEFIDDKTPKYSFPIIVKKKKSSGGLNVFKINNEQEYQFFVKRLKTHDFASNEWIIQEFIEGIPISCTTISNGNDTLVISINRQIIGLEFLNPPKHFMYCGNVVPGNLLKEDNELISNISIRLANKLGLKGINGFDFVLKNHYPYLMEINPRIPGSLSASEKSLNLNLMEMHIKSFNYDKWNEINHTLTNSNYNFYVTKLIIFAPKDISIEKIKCINELEYIYDKTVPNKKLIKGEPICSILFKAKKFADSYFGALKIADKINRIIM